MLCWKCLEKGKGSGQSGSFTCIFLPGLSVLVNVSTTPLSTDSAWDTFLPSTLHSFTSRPVVQGYVWSTMGARWLGPPRSRRFSNGTRFLTCSDFTYFLSKSPSLPLGPKGSWVSSSKGRTVCTDEKSDAQAGHTLSSGPSILCVVGRAEVLPLKG